MRSLIVLPVLALLAGCNPFASTWTDDCEDAFKYRLKSPSSYKRVDANVFSEDMTVDEYIAENRSKLVSTEIDNLRKDQPPIKRWYTLVTFDADNVMGVALRGKFSCEQVTKTGKEPPGGLSDTEKELMMKVDGKSGMDLQVDALKSM